MNPAKTLARLLLQRLVALRPHHALHWSARRLNLHSITCTLAPSSPFYLEGDGERLELPIDDVIAPFVVAHDAWQAQEIAFISSHLPREPCVLLDVGANVGLVTRQLLQRQPSIAAAVCFEPHPDNFRLLQRNLTHIERCHLLQLALGNSDGSASFYEDEANAGNYSLNRDAMRLTRFSTREVPCRRATSDVLLAPLPKELKAAPLLWKSDTQGHDELIMTSLPDDFWRRVHAGVMEIARIERPHFDSARLSSILAGFSVLRFSDALDRPVSVDEAIAFAAGSDGVHRDLCFAR